VADFYEVLGVPRGATAEQIKKAYRKRARELHPDANPDDPQAESQFKQVAEAYEVLSDPEKRARYDRFGTVGGPGGMGGTGGAPFGGGINDLFEAFFNMGGAGMGGGGGARRGPQRGVDLEVVVQLDLEDTVRGVEHEVKVRTAVACETCDATGAAPGTEATTCTQCNGAGQIRQVRQSILGQMVTTGTCPRCGGEGRILPTPCPDCSGEGRRVEDRTYTVDIPAGVGEGQTLRLSGRGAVGPRGGAPGDLYVEIRVRDHPVFKRAGDDLLADLHVAVTQAALGASIDFATLDGPEPVRIAAGTQTGRVLRLRDRGIPRLQGRGRGDLLLTVVVDTPGTLGDEEEELLRRLAALRGESVEPPSEGGFFSKIRSALS
jgi:molecular chaperone DnaJ